MREILFRGKHTRTGEWVEGLLWKNKYRSDKFFISCFPDKDDNEEAFIVFPETVGQYTGLTDKNGKKIFEGDIVKYDDLTGIINYFFGCYCVKTNKPDWRNRNNPAIDIVFNEYPNEIKVIGNIHDNPELLEGGVE